MPAASEPQSAAAPTNDTDPKAELDPFYCPYCRFDLRDGRQLARCPECGWTVEHAVLTSQLPWLRSHHRGTVRCFLGTCWMSLRRPELVISEPSHLYAAWARSFQRLVVVIWSIALLLFLFAYGGNLWEGFYSLQKPPILYISMACACIVFSKVLLDASAGLLVYHRGDPDRRAHVHATACYLQGATIWPLLVLIVAGMLLTPVPEYWAYHMFALRPTSIALSLVGIAVFVAVILWMLFIHMRLIAVLANDVGRVRYALLAAIAIACSAVFLIVTLLVSVDAWVGFARLFS